MADLGESPGGPAPPPPPFLDQTEARRAEKSFLETGPPPLSQDLDDRDVSRIKVQFVSRIKRSFQIRNFLLILCFSIVGLP